MIINFIRGLFMALADSVPGVSGGTIAFIMGFYDKFIDSLEGIIYGDKNKKKESLKFLIKIGIGWAFGMILAALVLAQLFEDKIYIISSLFLGFIIFAIPLIIKEEKDVIKKRYINILFSIIGIAIVILISFLNPSSKDASVDITHINLMLGLYIFIAGMVAISAMVLPGISGSTLLLIFGLYIPIMTGIKEVLHFNFSYLPALCFFAIGVISGILLVIKLLKAALIKYRSQTIYLIIGLMIGSIYAIIIGPTTLDTPKDSMSLKTFNILFFIIGGLVILGLEKLKKVIKENK